MFLTISGKEKCQGWVPRILAKLILNCLYGRFGLNTREITIEFVSTDRAYKLDKMYHLKENVKLNDKINLVKYSKKYSINYEVDLASVG